MTKKQKAIAENQKKVKEFFEKLATRRGRAMLVSLTYEEWLAHGQPSLDSNAFTSPKQNINPDDWDFYAKMDENMRIVSFSRILKAVQ
jgi:hypothetical protein